MWPVDASSVKHDDDDGNVCVSVLVIMVVVVVVVAVDQLRVAKKDPYQRLFAIIEHCEPSFTIVNHHDP